MATMVERENNRHVTIKCENNISFADVRKQSEQFYTAKPYASAAKQVLQKVSNYNIQ